MKKLFTCVLLFSSLSFGFYLPGTVYITPLTVRGQVCNYSAYPVRCQTSVVGYFPNWTYLFSNVNTIIMPGTCQFAYVNTRPPYYFVNGQAYANCF